MKVIVTGRANVGKVLSPERNSRLWGFASDEQETGMSSPPQALDYSVQPDHTGSRLLAFTKSAEHRRKLSWWMLQVTATEVSQSGITV